MFARLTRHFFLRLFFLQHHNHCELCLNCNHFYFADFHHKIFIASHSVGVKIFKRDKKISKISKYQVWKVWVIAERKICCACVCVIHRDRKLYNFKYFFSLFFGCCREISQKRESNMCKRIRSKLYEKKENKFFRMLRSQERIAVLRVIDRTCAKLIKFAEKKGKRRNKSW